MEIPAKSDLQSRRKCTAIYCRVSSGKKSQRNSLAAQLSFLTQYCAINPMLVLVDTFIDIASGSTVEDRPGLQRLIQDCEAGKIDYVLVKSISRFSRETLSGLQALRRICAHADIYFIQEHLGTESFSPSERHGELGFEFQFSIRIALDQAENESRNKNIQWGLRARAAQGTSKSFNKKCYGYDHDGDGNLIINKYQGTVVRLIFQLFLNGYSVLRIIDYLREENIPSPTGKDMWNKHTIEVILKQKKYTGDTELKIGNTVYSLEDHHPAIIPKPTFEAIQHELCCRSNMITNPDGTKSRRPTRYTSRRNNAEDEVEKELVALLRKPKN